MVLTLIGLFILTHFYRKKEKAISIIEARYYMTLKSYRENASPEIKQELDLLARQYWGLKGKTEQESDRLLEDDLKAFHAP